MRRLSCRHIVAVALTAFVCGVGASRSADAQPYPNRLVRIIVPYGPGGASDQLARAIAERLAPALRQPVIIENKPGGGTIIGTDYVAKAAPDGYTIGLTTFASLVSNPLLASSLPYRADSDFAGIGMLATSPMVMVVAPNVPARSVGEFVAYAKANPSRMNYGSSGAGSTVQLAAELFKSLAGIEMVHVPFKSSPEVLTAINGGFIQTAFDLVITAKPQIESGRVRALGVTDATRTALMPDVPTIAESGYPEYTATTWYGLIAPKGTPKDVIERLNAEVNRILQDDGLRKKFADLGMELKSSTPDAFMALAASDRIKWGKIVDAQGLKPK
jgi:tripartite-type tricarboxylate transporter receptor subunit TctC